MINTGHGRINDDCVLGMYMIDKCRVRLTLHICERKLLFLILEVFLLAFCFFLHFMGSFSLSSASIFDLSRISHNHSGYSWSSNATGSSPFLRTFKFKTVPGAHEDFGTLNVASEEEKPLTDAKRVIPAGNLNISIGGY